MNRHCSRLQIRGQADMAKREATTAVYVISVAAELAGVHPQTLRIYERRGLVSPARTSGGSRRYSDDDIALLRRVQELTDDGLNLSGVKRVLALESEVKRLNAQLRQLELYTEELSGESMKSRGVAVERSITLYKQGPKEI